MKCGIMTFYFAHNYGATLQAYALKKHLEYLGIETHIIKYIPEKLKKEYSLNPFSRSKHPKAIIKRILKLPICFRQFKIFEKFIKEDIVNDNSKEVSDYSVVFFGSDQIWNEMITGEIEDYFGSQFHNIKKVSYAGSFGTNELTEFQRKMISKYLTYFDGISLREESNKKDVEKICGKTVESVLDPVFLLSEDNWRKFSVRPKSLSFDDKYIFFYALRHDKELVRYVKEIAEKENCKVIAVHPTCINLDNEFIHLNDVGPREFVYLLSHSQMVGTNSFHAMAFSAIFKKRTIYKAYSENESRIPDLLSNFKINCDKMQVSGYDYSKYDYSNFEKKITESKNFIKTMLSPIEDLRN